METRYRGVERLGGAFRPVMVMCDEIGIYSHQPAESDSAAGGKQLLSDGCPAGTAGSRDPLVLCELGMKSPVPAPVPLCLQRSCGHAAGLGSCETGI